MKNVITNAEKTAKNLNTHNPSCIYADHLALGRINIRIHIWNSINTNDILNEADVPNQLVPPSGQSI